MIGALKVLLASKLVYLVVAQDCASDFNSFRQCLNNQGGNTPFSAADFHNCFEINNCAAPTFEHAFLLGIGGRIPDVNGGVGGGGGAGCFSLIQSKFPTIQQCARNQGFDWFTMDLNQQEQGILSLLLTNNGYAMSRLCRGRMNAVNAVRACHQQSGVDVNQANRAICAAKNGCDRTNGFSPSCVQQNVQMTHAACDCLKTELLRDNGQVFNDLVQCYFGQVPPQFTQQKALLMERVRRHHCNGGPLWAAGLSQC